MKNSRLEHEDIWGIHHIMITAAHRYCLGRRTYIVSLCVDWLKLNWKKIEPETKKRILIETKEALDVDQAGDESDRRSWEDLLKFANYVKEESDDTSA